ncbi:MAG TPA: MarR family transcriptional regulator [Acidobacteriaceae bacterium]
MYIVFMVQRNNLESQTTELVLAFGLLMRRLRSATPSETHGLSWTQMAVLKRLDTEGPTTTADLARAEGVKPQSMGTAIAALEEMGLVERKPHASDGRQMNIQVTARGAAMRKSSKDAKLTWLAQAVAKLDAKDQKNLPTVTELIKRLAEL